MDTKMFYILFGAQILLLGACSSPVREELDMPSEVAILSFSVNGVQAEIKGDTIRMTAQRGTDRTAVAPVIELTPGAVVTPASGETVNFSQRPVNYRVTCGNLYRDYYVTLVTGDVIAPRTHGRKIGYINWEDTEKTQGQENAWAWLKATYPDSCDILSLWDIQHGWVDMDQYALIWYHTRGVAGNGTLPFRAYDSELVEQMKAYTNTGGNLLLTGMAPRWLETLSLVPQGCAPNNFYGHEALYTISDGVTPTDKSHPVFANLSYTGDKIHIISDGCTIENNTSAWYLASWGGYDNELRTWETRTGGKALATDMVDGNTVTRVVMAEWAPSSSRGAYVITVNTGLYDWAVVEQNAHHEQMERLTRNAIEYLRNLKVNNR